MTLHQMMMGDACFNEVWKDGNFTMKVGLAWVFSLEWETMCRAHQDLGSRRRPRKGNSGRSGAFSRGMVGR